jgi:hypothetical protein
MVSNTATLLPPFRRDIITETFAHAVRDLGNHTVFASLFLGHNMDLLTDRRTHQPLTRDIIRLLTLQPGLFNNPIHCQLEQVSLSARHAYEALPYAWGDARDTSPMILDRTPYYITKNLECALRYLRYSKRRNRLHSKIQCFK